MADDKKPATTSQQDKPKPKPDPRPEPIKPDQGSAVKGGDFPPQKSS